MSALVLQNVTVVSVVAGTLRAILIMKGYREGWDNWKSEEELN